MKDNYKFRLIAFAICLLGLAANMIFETQIDELGMARAAALAALQTVTAVICAELFYDKLNKVFARVCLFAAPVFASAYAFANLAYRVAAYGDLSNPDAIRGGYLYAVITAAVSLVFGYLCAAVICVIFHKLRKKT